MMDIKKRGLRRRLKHFQGHRLYLGDVPPVQYTANCAEFMIDISCQLSSTATRLTARHSGIAQGLLGIDFVLLKVLISAINHQGKAGFL